MSALLEAPVRPTTNGRIAEMVDDRPADGVFRVDRAVYCDRDTYERELSLVFERNWFFVCHEAQIPTHGDYFSAQVARQRIFAIRQKDGGIGAFLNACAHRGAVLTPMKQGRATTLTCRFHGWCYNAEGRCTKIKNEKEGWPEGAKRENFSLTPLARVESYRGFVFASFTEEVPPLRDYLGAAAGFIDLLADQSPDGLEVVKGYSTYVINGNWKLQAENGVDGYHVSTVHRVFANAMAAREAREGREGMARTEAGRIAGTVPTGCYDLGNGHMLIWAERATPEVAPLYEARERLEAKFGPQRMKWMLGRGRNLLLFPNVLLMDQPSTQIRIFRPLSVDRTEVTVYCIAPKGESDKARAARLRKFEDFYMVTGMATPDDLAALEDVEAGSHATGARWNDLSRGMATMIPGADEPARELGITPVSSNVSWDHETLYHGFYREWRRLMSADRA